jgi:Flp pilus assembly CpaF family ATPase
VEGRFCVTKVEATRERGGEALDMLTATTAGWGGSLFTLHASPPPDGARRVEALSLIGDLEPPHSHDSQLRPWPRDPGPVLDDLARTS